MLLKLTHQTDLTYSDLISESVMELRMAPRQEQDQHRLSFTLAVGPPTSAFSYFDWLGNSVHAFTVNSFHNQIRIVATSVVETDRIRVQPERFADRWPISPDSFDYSNWDYLQFGGPIVDCPKLRELVELLGPEEGMSLGELALRMLHLLAEKFTYRKGVTNAASPITEILEHGSGVCQDFTHLMIALARALKIPARYVSGLIHPDAQKYRGFTQTHAWCELLFPSAGWVGLDAANNCIVGGNFVKVAVGRGFGDVPPNKGIYRGKAEESIEVAVHSEELRVVPPELAAERLQSLAIPIFPGGKTPHIDLLNQQQEQQQQQAAVETRNSNDE
ncbi:MAG TPA: transglutaminase family protein [Tepidisphaeraceae bacterium]|nr:transglutaminase family protein [Tepidisphaeraceae bacterium]